MHLKKVILKIICLVFLFAPACASAEIKYIDLTNPFLRKIPIAVPVCKALGSSASEAELVKPVSDQIAEMLEFTGYFKILDRASFLYDPQSGGITGADLKMANWTTVGAELLITGGVQVSAGNLVLELRLFDTFKNNMLIGKRYSGSPEDQRMMIKRFCSEVIQSLTGRPGIFDSQIAFASNGSGFKEIYVCDFDGKNVHQITNKHNITAFPNWSSDGRYLTFTSFANGPPQIFTHDMKSGLENNFHFKGVQIAPNWIPNRFELTATLSFEGDQEIYLLTGGGKTIKRLTNSSGIDVEASMSPDGKLMAFVSQRAGTPQVYIQEMSGDHIRRLTFHGQYNTQPSWSPKGDKIAYSSMEDGQVNIYVIDTDGNHPIRLTYNQGDNEAPSWSPDGSLIVFSSTREGRSRIYVMTAFGTDQRRLLDFPGEQRQPKWSPNIHNE